MTEDTAPHLLLDSQSRPFFRASLSKKIALVFSFFLIVALANVVVVHYMLQQFNGVAATVNVAGKLRYLSQQIAMNTSNALNGWSPGRSAALAAISDYEEALNALTQGGVAYGFDIRRLSLLHKTELQLIRREWNVYRAEMEALLEDSYASTPSAGHMGQISISATRMLTNAERLLQAMTMDAQREQNRALTAVYFLLALDILVVVVVFLLMRRQIVHPLRILAERSRELAEGNYHVRIGHRSADEIGQLADAFNYSANRIGNLIGRIELERQHLAEAESMFRGVADNSMVGVYIAQDGKFLYANAKMAQMFAYDRDAMTTSVGIYDLVPDTERRLVENNQKRRLAGELPAVHYQRKARRKDGSTFDIEVFGSTMEIDGRAATIGIMLDITERKQAEATMQLATMVYQNSSEGMTITDPDGVVIDVNPAFTKITGYSRQEIIGQRISLLSSGRQDRAFYEAMWQSINTTGQWQGEIWNRRKNGEVYAEWLTVNSYYDADGSVFRRIALFSDITQKKRTDDLVWKQANFDSLTGLPNRLMFRDRLEQEIRKAHRAGLLMAVMFLDLDRFKEINDTLGHAVGDTLLKQASMRLSNCVRESDTVARLGGDEFTVILGELNDTKDVERVAQDILQKLCEPFVLGDEVAYVSASIGITFYPSDATELEDLLKNADQAMYAAKEQGRNRFHYFTPSMQETAQARRRVASDLRKALSHNQLCVYYQPIVDLQSGRICKAEALVRWRHPTRGLVSPAEFIPIAEDTGMIVDIGDWVFRQAAVQAERWRALVPDFQISVNTSPVQYRSGGIGHDSWFEHLAALNVPPQGITVEITEGLLLETNASITDQLLKFRDAGIQVALDDFGTGYSSMSYLKKLDIDYLKIDRSFSTNLSAESEDMALYEAMIVMAHKLGIKVIAEGVETKEQHELLRAVGCDLGQGFLYSRPVPADQFEEFLKERHLV
ncbi:MAG TPA: EAL domain-containing protein [Noviherbaspirillum sp.]